MRALYATGRFHIVAIGALGALTFGWNFFGRQMWLVAAVVALDWYLVNLLNRVVDLPEDRQNNIVGTDFVARHRSVLLWGGIATLVTSFVVVQLVASTLTPFRIAFHALGFAYNWPLLPGKRRIKQLYFWKNTASAVGFLLTVFAYPIALGLHEGATMRVAPLGVFLLAAFFMLFELSYEVLYDLRDTPGDRAAGIMTYSVVHGERVARRIVDGLVLASCAILIGAFFAGVVPWRAAVMVTAPLVQLIYYKVRGAVDARDCIRLTWIGALLFVLYNGWIRLGLPGV